MIERCGFCLHYRQEQGQFGNCGAGMRKEFGGTTFSTNEACSAFVHREKRKNNVRPWQNPIIRRKTSSHEIINFKEARENILKRRKLDGSL